MSAGARAERIGTQALGLVFLLVIAILGWLTIAVYDKTFSSDVPVTLRADRVGNQLSENADVKVKGLIVGSVRQVRVVEGGTEIELALDPEKLPQLPKGVTARLLPKSVFGQRFVSLVLPEKPGAGRLAEGDVIAQDRTGAAIELEKLLNDLMPLLQAVQPHKLAASLGSIAEALDGRGARLGGTLVKLNQFLEELNPHLPQLQRDIVIFADVLDAYDAAGPDIIDALSDMATTGKTISERREDLRAMLVTVAAASDGLREFLGPNKENLIKLAANNRTILRLIEQHSARFPCLFDSITKLKPLVDRALGKGTSQPGLHIELSVKRPNTGSGQNGGSKC